MITKEKWNKLIELMATMQIQQAELIEKFIIGNGNGGQRLHKRATTVYLKHIPTGLEIKCQDSRSREDNRYFARVRLCEKLHATVSDEKSEEQLRIEKLKKQKKRRGKRAQQKIVEEKARQD